MRVYSTIILVNDRGKSEQEFCNKQKEIGEGVLIGFFGAFFTCRQKQQMTSKLRNTLMMLKEGQTSLAQSGALLDDDQTMLNVN